MSRFVPLRSQNGSYLSGLSFPCADAGQAAAAMSVRQRARTLATTRSQRSPLNWKTSPVAISSSRANDSRSIPRARNMRDRTVASGIDRHAAVSPTDRSSTSRTTNTVRNATGSSSIFCSSRRPRLLRGRAGPVGPFASKSNHSWNCGIPAWLLIVAREVSCAPRT
jgi:hypothetical protein